MRPKALIVTALAVSVATAGCRRQSEREDHAQLPRADEWEAPTPRASTAGAADPHGAYGGAGAGIHDPHAGLGMADPHAGLGMGDPHAGLGMGDPHAGLGMGDPHAGLGMGDPHAGLGMGDPHGHGMGDPHGGLPALEPPDPNRPIDASKFLRGQIVAADPVKDRVRPGSILFLSVRPIEPLSGDVIGSPLAVDRIDVRELPIKFHLDASKAMSAGTGFEGDVVILARIDQDGDALTKEPGDVVGEIRTKIPSDDLTLVLDTLLR